MKIQCPASCSGSGGVGCRLGQPDPSSRHPGWCEWPHMEGDARSVSILAPKTLAFVLLVSWLSDVTCAYLFPSPSTVWEFLTGFQVIPLFCLRQQSYFLQGKRLQEGKEHGLSWPGFGFFSCTWRLCDNGQVCKLICLNLILIFIFFF